MIECAVIDGWTCVVAKKDNFAVGDSVIYCEVDSLMPEKPEFEFLAKYHYRIKTQKLRGQISQGLVLPIAPYLGKGRFELGEDVSDSLGVTLYVKPEDKLDRANDIGKKGPKNRFFKYLMRYGLFRWLWFHVLTPKEKPVRDHFPDWVPKTDEERIQNMPELFEKIKNEKIPLVVTEKIDGTSATYFQKRGEPFGICSRNWKLLRFEGDMKVYGDMAEKYDIPGKFRTLFEADKDLAGLIWQGEIHGFGIQGNKYALSEKVISIFNMFRLGKDGVLRKLSRAAMMRDLDIANSPGLISGEAMISGEGRPAGEAAPEKKRLVISAVPLIGIRKEPFESYQELEDWIKTIKHRPDDPDIVADKKKNANAPIEGVVCRDDAPEDGSPAFSFKYINPFFLVKFDE
jgi:hypothetical protein